ncbi:MAG: iron ABC transporter permease [Limnochordales bacterium]
MSAISTITADASNVKSSTPRAGVHWLAVAYFLAGMFIVLFLVVPLGAILLDSMGLIAADHAVPADFFSYMLRITWNSLRLALLTTAVSLAIAIPLAVAIAKLKPALSGVWTVLLTLPLITPPFISSFATILLLGRTGVLTRMWEALGFPGFSIYGLPGLVITQVLHLMPYALLIILAGLRSVPAHIEEAAVSLGGRFGGIVAKVVLPYIFPHILMGGVLVFLTSLGDVGAPLLIGGNYRVLPVEIYSNFISFLGDDRIPILFSAWIVLISMVMLVFVRRLLRKTEVEHEFRTRTYAYDLPKLRRIATAFCAATAFVFLLPYVVIVISSFGTVWSTGWLPNAFTLDHYSRVLRDTGPIHSSLIVISGAMPLTLFVSIFVGQMSRSVPRLGFFDYLSLLPFVIPGVVIGFGLTRAYGSLVIGGIDFARTALILIVALAVRRLAHVVRVVAAGFARVDRSLEEAAWSLGASESKTFADVVLPQLRPTIVAGAVIALIKLITELGTTLILYPPGWETMPVYIYYYVSEGQISRGAAMSVILIILVAIGTAVSNRLNGNREVAIRG